MRKMNKTGIGKRAPEGSRETARETIIRLDETGLDIEIICQATNMPSSEIENILRAAHSASRDGGRG